MFEKPDVGRIEKLHRIGRQLAVLKRMYQSYSIIIDRILERTKTASHLPSAIVEQDTANFISTSTFGVTLNSNAVVRFERLQDRIRSFALNEIQDCIDEKESLVFLVYLAKR